jgi:hypothetical protein
MNQLPRYGVLSSCKYMTSYILSKYLWLKYRYSKENVQGLFLDGRDLCLHRLCLTKAVVVISQQLHF